MTAAAGPSVLRRRMIRKQTRSRGAGLGGPGLASRTNATAGRGTASEVEVEQDRHPAIVTRRRLKRQDMRGPGTPSACQLSLSTCIPPTALVLSPSLTTPRARTAHFRDITHTLSVLSVLV
ncbi:hypothetical protein CISG_05188 [Coccidioides immitis RMSCC 3703]|uniref:Uncharacterized protein n=2 Tax=Coccidioides immitis TaxID=5501 RepID=A0A0J8QTK2_COCIT|nr:hypothetical protein CIRG_00128 [Coccidioides immitis RMSCC 2394]KMU75791.1 hypothetical protein CISG_05188 [Coccidioides immitis RMSCC 3703]